MKLKSLLFLVLFLKFDLAFAQTKDSILTGNISTEVYPIPIEIFAGNKGYTFQLIVSKQFSPKSKFGFFNINSFTGDYKGNNQSSDFLSQSFLTAELCKAISLAVGLSAIGYSATPLTVRPTAGLQYLLVKQNLVIVVLPRFDLTQTYNFETFATLEYKPMLSTNWGIYTRIDGLYNYNIKLCFNEISSIYLRLGMSYKNIQFGIGMNYDSYESNANNVKNFGVFIKTDLF